MDRESMRRLRMDRRLIRRRGWLPEAELQRELAALPDVSHKIAAVEGEAAAPPDASHGIAPVEGEPSAPSEQTETPPIESPEEPHET